MKDQAAVPTANTLVDFGCADASMLDALVGEFPNQIKRAYGFDQFKGEIPNTLHPNVVNLLPLNIFHDLPCGHPDESVNFVIVSAFLKHNPSPGFVPAGMRTIIETWRAGRCS